MACACEIIKASNTNTSCFGAKTDDGAINRPKTDSVAAADAGTLASRASGEAAKCAAALDSNQLHLNARAARGGAARNKRAINVRYMKHYPTHVG